MTIVGSEVIPVGELMIDIGRTGFSLFWSLLETTA